MEKLGFKFNFQFLPYIKECDGYAPPKIQTAEHKWIEDIHDQLQIIINCAKLLYQIKQMSLMPNFMSLTDETKLMFLQQVTQSARCQLLNVPQHFQNYMDHVIIFPKCLNCSRFMLKSVEERRFYDAFTHEEALRYNGQLVLLQQQLYISKILESIEDLFHLTRKEFQLQRDFPALNNQNLKIVSNRFDLWFSNLQLNQHEKLFINDVKSYIIGKQQLLKTFQHNKSLTNERILQILYFFLWTTKVEQSYLHKMKDNQIRIRNKIEVYLKLLKQKLLEWKCLESSHQEWKIFFTQMHEKTQILLNGVESAQTSHLSHVEINNSNNSFAKMQIRLNEIIAEQKNFSAALSHELAKYNEWQ